MTTAEPALRNVQRGVAVLCLGFVALIVTANLGCAPKYFQRGDVIALLGIALLDATVLLGSTARDTDGHRLAGGIASASATVLFLSTISIPVLAVPLTLAGVLRLPRSRPARLRLLVALPAAIVLTAGLVALGQAAVRADQLRCP